MPNFSRHPEKAFLRGCRCRVVLAACLQNLPRLFLALFLLSLSLPFTRAADAAGAENASGGGWQAVITEHAAIPAYLIGVDKSRQELSFFERRSPLRLSRVFACTTGQAVGDKAVEGDLKTPEGIYFVVQRIGSGLDFIKYGNEAYTLNYPNPVDRLRKKTGYGIWIHGRGEPLVPLQTEGCVSMNNDDLTALGRLLVPGTPVAMGQSLAFNPKSLPEDAADSRVLAQKVEDWSSAWAARSSKYFDFYDANAYSLASEPFSAFRAQKERIFKAMPWIKSTVSDVQVLKGPGYWVTWFYQDYQAPNLSTRGVRRLYWSKNDKGEFRILGMEWHPGMGTSTLLASADSLLPPMEGVSSVPEGWARDLHTRSATPAPASAPAPNKTPEQASLVASASPAPQSPAPAPRQNVTERENTAPSPAEAADRAASRPDQAEFASGKELPRPSPQAFALAEAMKKERERSGAATTAPLPATDKARSADAAHPAFSLPPALPSQGLAPGAATPPAPSAGAGQPAPAAQAPVTAAAPAPRGAEPAALAQQPEKTSPQTPAASDSAPALAAAPERQAPAPEPESRAKPAAPTSVVDIVSTVAVRVEDWRKAWESGDLDAYMAFYAPKAKQGSRNNAQSIRRQKAQLWSRTAPAEVRLENLRGKVQGEGAGRHVAADMQQLYTDSKGGGDNGVKTLIFTEHNGVWLITQEDWSPLSDETGH